MKTRTSKVTVLFLVMTMVIAMFGGVINAATTSTIDISKIVGEVTVRYQAPRADIKAEALNAPQIAEKYATQGDAWLEQKLDEAGIGATYPVDVVGTVEYNAATKSVSFVGDATINVTIGGTKVVAKVHKDKTLPISNVASTVIIDGVSYTCQYSSSTGKITCSYPFPDNKDKVDVRIASFIANATFDGEPAQVIYNSNGSTVVSQLKVNGAVKYDIGNPRFTSIEAAGSVNGTPTTITNNTQMQNGTFNVNITRPAAPTPVNPTPSNPTPAPTTETGVAGFVERLYTVALGRASDPNGKAAWIAAIRGGESGAEAAKGFLFSDEFLNKNMSNADFVTILYKTFFDRQPDAAGHAAWVAALERGDSKQDVIMGFINSTEWANVCLRYGIISGGTGTPSIEVEPNDQVIAFATRLYTTCLKRNPDQNGLMAWARQLANLRDTGTNAAHGFFFSEEFLNQPISDDEFITRLYLTFMDRQPDQGGKDAWLNVLALGASREEVFQGFAQSTEFGQICANYGIIR